MLKLTNSPRKNNNNNNNKTKQTNKQKRNKGTKHQHGANLFTVIQRNRPIPVAFFQSHGDTEDIF